MATLVACGGHSVGGAVDAPPAATRPPIRIVSLDYCADQYVVGLADRAHILRVSPHATASYSWVREQARGLPSVRPRAEDVLILQPDLVVRSYGGGPKAGDFLAQAGIPVVQVPYVNDIAGAQRAVREMAEALGVGRRGQLLADDVARRMARLSQGGDEPAREVLYLSSTGASAGAGTLIDEIIRAAGHRNFTRRSGWNFLSLERLAYEQPEMLALAFFSAEDSVLDAWSPASHPVARRQIRDLPTVHLDASWVSCGGWFLVEAVEALAGARVSR